MEEIWKPITDDIIKNISPVYMVSNYGRIYTNYRKKICKLKNDNTLELALINGLTTVQVSRIVYKVFINNYIPDNYVVYFKDNNPNNLYYDNLYLVSRAEYKQIVFNNNAIINSKLSNEQISKANYYRKGNTDVIFRSNEIWADILDNNINNIKPWYKISNYGRVFNKATGCLVRTNIINSGYIRVQLRSNDNCKIDALVHRIVLMAYMPINNPYEMEVNHKDLNTFNNYIGNLEWVTPEQNAAYTADEYIDKYYDQPLTNEEVINICNALESNMPYLEICLYVLHRDYTGPMHRKIYKIHKRKIYANISCHYTF